MGRPPQEGAGDVAVVIPAAGRGVRLGAERNKVLLPLTGDRSVLAHSVACFQSHPAVRRIVVVTGPEERGALDATFPAGPRRARLEPWVVGGTARQDSVWNGLQTLEAEPPDLVLVHDGARPLCSRALIDRVLAALERAPGTVPVLPVTDTMRRIAASGSRVVPREALAAVQTPQGFRYHALLSAHRLARQRGFTGTDDAQLLEEAGMTLAFTDGDAWNIKITTTADLELARRLVVGWPEGEGAGHFAHDATRT